MKKTYCMEYIFKGSPLSDSHRDKRLPVLFSLTLNHLGFWHSTARIFPKYSARFKSLGLNLASYVSSGKNYSKIDV